MNQEQLVKTTLTFNPAFHQQLKSFARSSNSSMSQIVEQELMPLLKKKRKEKLHRVYDGLRALAGAIKDGTPDASATIDDFLYGKPGEGLKPEDNAA